MLARDLITAGVFLPFPGRLAMGCLMLLKSMLFLQMVAVTISNSPPSLSGPVISRVVAKVGKNTRLLCPAQSDPDLTQWKKDGQSINQGWERFKISPEGHLRIKDTEMTDAGLYTCIATNGFGSISINYTVVVLDEDKQIFQEADRQFKQSPNEDLSQEGVAPSFSELDKMKESINVIKPTGSTIRLSCPAVGNPTPDIDWLKNSAPYSHHQRRPHPTLRLHEVTEEDSGEYTCVARNRLGHVNFTYHIQIIDEIRQKPRLIAPHPLNQTAEAGGTVSFHCYIESVVTPQVQWLKRIDKRQDTADLNITLVNYQDEKYMVLKNAGVLLARSDGTYLNKLVLQKVQPQDAGMFVCFATNRKGFTTRQAYLDVRADSKGLHTVNSSKEAAEDSQNDLILPLLIGVPICVIVLLFLIFVFLVRRCQRCKVPSDSSKPTQPPLPSEDKDLYYYNSCQQQQQQHQQLHIVNPLLSSQEKLPKTPSSSVDTARSDFSSVSRTNNMHTHMCHPSMNYSYSSVRAL